MADLHSYHHYTTLDIDRYLSRQMTAPEMHELEKAALQDPFLSDAIEGYKETDRQQAGKHLVEIAAAIEGHLPRTKSAKIIPMPARKKYSWQLAASVVTILAIGIFFLLKSSNRKSDILASRNQTPYQWNDTAAPAGSPVPPAVQQDSLLAQRQTSAPESAFKMRKSNSKKQLQKISIPPWAKVTDYARATPRPEPQVKNDSSSGNTTSPITLAGRASLYKSNLVQGKFYPDSSSVNPSFVLSELDEVQIGNRPATASDTAQVKPEGGWRSFQTYLLSKTGLADTTARPDLSSLNPNIELEFSLDDVGRPYNIQVIQAPDSSAAKSVADALQTGPKWITKEKKGRRFNLRY